MSIIPSSKSFGDRGEELVKEYLEARGFLFVTRNFHARFGELDFVMRDRKRLYFVEVKTRRSDGAGNPEEFVSEQKLDRIRKTIPFFILKNFKFKNFEKEILVVSVLIRGNQVYVEIIPVE